MSVTDELQECADVAEKLLAEDGWVRLPVDADGKVIHIGDTLDGYGETTVVRGLALRDDGWSMTCENGLWFNFTAFTHHHEPTVEDVLREFAEKITDSQIPGVHPTYEESIAEYSAKFRLADDGEEQ